MNNDIIVGMGEALWDCFGDNKKIGGAPANFAYHVSQFGLPACVVSAVGKDEDGDEIMRNLTDKGLDLKIQRVAYPTGKVNVTLDEHKVPQYEIVEDVAWDNIPFTPELEELARNTRAVCFGSLAQRNSVSHSTITRFLDAMPDDGKRLKVFDVNLRQHFYTPKVLQESIRRSNVLKINDDEIREVGRMFGYDSLTDIDKCWLILGKYGLKMLILTCGTEGSYVFTPGEMSFMPTPVVKLGDTVGAGDSFTAAFIASILNGETIRRAHKRAVDTSAFVCTQIGAMPTLPDHLKQ